MKYKTFRMLVTGGALTLCVGSGFVYDALRSDDPPPTSPSPVAGTSSDPAHPASPAQPASPDPTGSPDGLRELDRQILARLQQGVTEAKVKDAFPGMSWKANLYRDDGYATVNRLKLDLDRDEKWDEKWTIEAQGVVKRQVASQDDEAYDAEYRLEGERWRTKLAGQEPPAAPIEAAAPTDGGASLRPLDEQILTAIRRGISGDKQKDAIPGDAKVNLYQDAGQDGVNRLKVDLDRDGQDDEKWTIEREGGVMSVKRQVSPADDGSYPEEFRLQHGRWVPKP